MKKLLKQTLKISVLLLAIFYQGCKIDDALLPEVIAGFTYTLNEDTGTVTFINISEEARTYSWTFGDGGSSTEINPINTYASGTYTVTLEASNVAGGSDTFEDEIVINIAALCIPETAQSLSAGDFSLTFQSDPTASIGSFDAVLTSVSNPDFDNEVNTSCQVGQIDRNGEALFANNQIEFDTKLDFNANRGFKMKVWSPVAGTKVLVKLEDKADTTIFAEVEATTTSASEWEELTFSFASGESDKYDNIILFFELNTNTTETYFIDDFALFDDDSTGGGECTAETAQSLNPADFNLTFQTDPGSSVGSFDAVLTSVSNPDFDNEVNTSCQVGQIDRNGGALFANNQIEFDTKLDFNVNSGFKMKVWSPVAGTKVLVKLEDKADTTIFAEVEVTTTKASEWEELTFSFASGESDKYDNIILFFELNTNTTETYFIDDFALFSDGSTGGGECTAETAQSLSAVDFNLTFQTDPGSSIGSFDAVLTTIANPDFEDTINTSCQVGQIARSGSAPFANNQIEFDTKFNFSENAGFKMKVWSPTAGTNVLVKLEDKANSGTFTQLSVATTKSNEWEELTFPFASSENGKYDLIILFFELDTNTTETYFIDDFGLYPREIIVGGDNLLTNGDFETGNSNSWVTDSAGTNGTFEVSSQMPECGNFSANLSVDVDAGGGGASVMLIKQTNVGAGVVMPNSPITVSFDLRGSLDGVGGVIIAELLSEFSGGGATSEILSDGVLSPNGAWTRYDFTTTTGADVSGGITLLLKAECGAVAGCAVNAFIDNVYIGLDGGGPECDNIPNNGTPSLSFDATTITVNETAGTATIAVNLNGSDVAGGFTVDYATADGSAVQPGDYSSTSGTLTFVGTIGESQNIVVPISDDVVVESQENFVLNLSNSTVTINALQATVNITDNDGTSSQLAENGDFETGNLDGWAVFENGGSIIADNTESNGGIWSAKLVATPTGANPTLKQERKGAGTLSIGDIVQITFDYKGSLSGIGGVFSLQSFVEATNGVNQIENFSVTPTSSWQTFTQTFTVEQGMQSGDISGGITAEFVAICGSDPATNCVSTLSLDNVSIVINP